MWRIHHTFTAILAIAIVVLSILLIRERAGTGGPGDSDPARSGPHIERVTDAETTLRKLGYTAWVFRWQGGMIDGELRSGPNDEKPRTLGGQSVWEEIQLSARQQRLDPPPGWTTADSGPVDLSNLSGMLVVAVGSGEDGPLPIPLPDRGKATVPCRVYLEAGLGTDDPPRVIEEFVEPVAFALPASQGTQADLAVNVFGQWKKVGDARRADLDSRYTLLQLRWLSENEQE